MAVSLESKSKTSTSAWTSIFPTEQVTSVSESIKFMKKFAAVGVSTILYLRTNLPDDTFSVKNVDGMRVSIMNPTHGVAKAMCSGRREPRMEAMAPDRALDGWTTAGRWRSQRICHKYCDIVPSS